MKPVHLPAFILLFLLSSCASETEQERADVSTHVTNFGLHDQNSTFHELYYYSAHLRMTLP